MLIENGGWSRAIELPVYITTRWVPLRFDYRNAVLIMEPIAEDRGGTGASGEEIVATTESEEAEA